MKYGLVKSYEEEHGKLADGKMLDFLTALDEMLDTAYADGFQEGLKAGNNTPNTEPRNRL